MKLNSEQHIPIFVGSTYLDLKEYRAKVKDTLTRMETFVHGMEQFGARPGSPVQECLAEVAKCKIYIGIFAMRYGSIPAGHDKSLTELEYDEAQRLNLPSYIFLIDEQSASIHPRDVDLKNLDKLEQLKEKLKKKHTVEFFTAPDDLANKVGSAIHRALKEYPQEQIVIEKGIENVIPAKSELTEEQLLSRFKYFPERWTGIRFKSSVSNFKGRDTLISPRRYDDFFAKHLFTSDEIVYADWYSIATGTPHFYLYAEKDNAYKMIETNYPAFFDIEAETCYYALPDAEDCVFKGIIVKKVTKIIRAQIEGDIIF